MSPPEGLCGACTAPGYCCKGFTLNSRDLAAAETDLEALVALASIYTEDCQGRGMVGLPFVLAGWRSSGEARGVHRARRGPEDFRVLDCLNLGADGRCMEYANRPRLCVDYEAGHDALCIMHQPSPAGDDQECRKE